jgi:hypothetical protein
VSDCRAAGIPGRKARFQNRRLPRQGRRRRRLFVPDLDVEVRNGSATTKMRPLPAGIPNVGLVQSEEPAGRRMGVPSKKSEFRREGALWAQFTRAPFAPSHKQPHCASRRKNTAPAGTRRGRAQAKVRTPGAVF